MLNDNVASHEEPGQLSNSTVAFLRQAFAKEYELRELLVQRLKRQYWNMQKLSKETA